MSSEAVPRVTSGRPERDEVPRSIRQAGSIASGLALAAILFALSSFAAGKPEEAPRPVTLAPVTEEILRAQVTLSGTSIPHRRAMLSPRVEGLVTEVRVDEGSRVNPGDPILELDSRLAEIEIQAVEARVREATARHRDAVRIREELERLEKGRHASKTSIESAIADVEIAAAVLSREQADFERAKELKSRHRVTAPFAGMVVSKQVEVGQWVKRDSVLVELVAMDVIRVRAPLPQRFYSRIASGSQARLLFDALPAREIEGTIGARIALGNQSSRSFPLLIDIPNPDRQLAPGMSARVLVELEGETTPVLTVPRDALITKADGSRRVWRLREEEGVSKAYPVHVETGRSHGERVEVTNSDLQAGERVVLLGNETLRPGQVVQPRDATPAVAAD